MKDIECSESENVTFTVEVSHATDAFWTFKKQPLKASAKYKMESKNKRHTLTVVHTMKDEEGEYMFAAGEKTCSGKLTVSGTTDATQLISDLSSYVVDLTELEHTGSVSCHQVALSRSLCTI